MNQVFNGLSWSNDATVRLVTNREILCDQKTHPWAKGPPLLPTYFSGPYQLFSFPLFFSACRADPCCWIPCFFLSFLKKYLLIYLALLQVLAASWIFSCSVWPLSCRSSPTMDQTQASCIGSTEFQPQHHQGSPSFCVSVWIRNEPRFN
jgi:hypothetical protein